MESSENGREPDWPVWFPTDFDYSGPPPCGQSCTEVLALTAVPCAILVIALGMIGSVIVACIFH